VKRLAILPRLAALLFASLLAVSAHAQSRPGDSARDVIADGLYLESGMGDFAAAAERYRELTERTDVPEHVLAEAWFRLGRAEERLGNVQPAEAAYQHILEEMAVSRWAEDARSRLQSIEEDRKRVRGLPVRYAFTEDTGGLFHARTHSHKGTLEHEVLEDNDGRHEVAVWRTYVAAREDDLTQVGFAAGVTVKGELTLLLRAVNFPAHYVFFLVNAEGRRFGTATQVVRPEDGWKRLSFSADDFRDRASGSEDPYAPEPITNLWIQDVTGYASTDRGENIIWIDELGLQ